MPGVDPHAVISSWRDHFQIGVWESSIGRYTTGRPLGNWSQLAVVDKILSLHEGQALGLAAT